jgi:hypothetical protein
VATPALLTAQWILAPLNSNRDILADDGQVSECELRERSGHFGCKPAAAVGSVDAVGKLDHFVGIRRPCWNEWSVQERFRPGYGWGLRQAGEVVVAETRQPGMRAIHDVDADQRSEIKSGHAGANE